MNFISLRSFDSYIEANIVLNMLIASHVNCHLKDEHTITIDPLLSSALGGIKLMVHHAHAEKAMEILEEVQMQHLRTIPCPVCKSFSLKIVSTTKKYACRLSALISTILNGQSLEIKKMYVCDKCDHDFKELPETKY
jgi:Zn finger protein HypA/HybF involved in hydrogenase expression